MHAKSKTELVPLRLQDAPALIETVFPAQKVSFEAQTERKAGAGQTLTALGSYWKGRKPLILVRAILLGSLLPSTDNAEADLEVFEKLMAFDDEGLARRALAAKSISPSEFAARIELDNPWDYFDPIVRRNDVTEAGISLMKFPLDAEEKGISLRWKRNITDDDKLVLYRVALKKLSTYEEKASIGQRPEEVDQDWLYAPTWPAVNRHYAELAIHAHSFPDLIEQLGILRYGHRPRVGDTFCGGGSIPFEAARLGCDAYASDLNPIACMLTWGALNIIGGQSERRAEIERAQREIADAVDQEITAIGIEQDDNGNRAKAYLYCLETRCPETGWRVPMAPSWIISKTRSVIARLNPDYANKRFDIEVLAGVSESEMNAAEIGTVQDGRLVYELNGKTYRTPIKTLRGDYRLPDGSTGNQLRRWGKHDFQPAPEDIFQERLYAIQWIAKNTIDKRRQETFFAAVSEQDEARERQVANIVAENLARWQEQGLVPDLPIEPGDKTDEPIRTRGWTYWHHLFSARHLFGMATFMSFGRLARVPATFLDIANKLDNASKLTRQDASGGNIGREPKMTNVFSNQALNPLISWAERSIGNLPSSAKIFSSHYPLKFRREVECKAANGIAHDLDLYITDPPYADAVHYHEITEFFIAWLRKDPPAPFDHWVWDSRRALAIKGSGEDFRQGMVAAYKAMTEHMPDNGMQCVMFTHQDTTVWGDLVGIFWAAGLQVVAAWYIATETTSELKKGGYVQGTVILLLKKRLPGERAGFKQRLLPAVRQEVERQIKTMMHLNDTVKAHQGEPVFNDSDLQMAGYAAALKVLTAYTHIGGEDVTAFALRPRVRGEITVVDEIVQQAAETASNLLVPEGLSRNSWSRLTGMERFVLRMLDMETTGSAKLDNYQNFAKAFHVEDYSRVMGDMRPNHARLKRVTEFSSRDLTDSTELGASRLGRLIIGLQQLLRDTEPQVIVEQLREEMADFLEIRPLLLDLLEFIETKASEANVRTVAETLGARLKNLRFGT